MSLTAPRSTATIPTGSNAHQEEQRSIDYTIAPNGLGQSYIGVKGMEPIAWDWSLVFKLQNGFDPYTLQRANGPKSLVQNNTTPLDQQTANGDSVARGNCSTPRLTLD